MKTKLAALLLLCSLIFGLSSAVRADYAYTVRFYFDNYDIELVGQKRPWEDGGFISVPIQIR